MIASGHLTYSVLGPAETYYYLIMSWGCSGVLVNSRKVWLWDLRRSAEHVGFPVHCQIVKDWANMRTKRQQLLRLKESLRGLWVRSSCSRNRFFEILMTLRGQIGSQNLESPNLKSTRTYQKLNL